MLYSDEVGERDLRVAKRYAPVTSTRQDTSISESLKHKLYQRFLRNKKNILAAKFWAPIDRHLVLEACMVAGNVMWQTVFQRLLRHLMTCQEASGCTLYMHPATNSVTCTFLGADSESDVVCVCWTCGSKYGICHRVPLEVEAVHSWPTMGSKSRSKFKFCDVGRKDQKRKGKSDVGAIHKPVVSTPGSVRVVPIFEVEDSAASFQGPSEFSDHQRMQPMRHAKLLRIPIIDSDTEHQLVFPQGSSSISSSSSSITNSVSGSSSNQS